MEILNDLTQCNFYYYILGGNTTFNKAYLIFNYLQFNKNFECIGDAFIRRQNIKFDNRMVKILNKNLKQQYNLWKELISVRYIDLEQELIKYSRLGYLLVVQYLISKYEGDNININIISFIFTNHRALRGALRGAAVKGHLNIVQYLVKLNFNNLPYRKYRDYINGIYLPDVAKSGRLDIVQYLISKGANIYAFDDQTLTLAAKYNHLDVVKYLVSKGANIYNNGNEVLYWAAQNGHLLIVQYLVSIGANTDILTAKQKLEFNII